MYIKELKDKYTLILRKMNGQAMGIIFYQDITSISKGIQKISELTFTVSKHYGLNNEVNPLYDELKNERLIDLDDIETYVIKNVKETNDATKVITAYSREKKLCRSKVEFEDICLTLKTKDADVYDCYTLDELLYEDTGWKLGYISDRVLYSTNETLLDILNGVESEVTNVEKLRYQESVSTNWYDYIMEDISAQFECYPIFDSYNKLVNLYDESELGENLELLLSYDNYLKSNEKTTDTEEIVTRLTLIGNEDLTIVNCNPTGLRYIEDFSYYIENKEMSDELILAFERYEIVKNRIAKEWEQKMLERAEKNEEFEKKQKSLLMVYSMIQSLETAINMAEDGQYKAMLSEQLQQQKDERVLLEDRGVNILYEDIRKLSEEITELNFACRKENAEDDKGKIFTTDLLDELKEFIYQDTYSNDNIISDKDLIKMGMVKLSELSQPTKSWSIDSVNFVERLIDNGFRNQWQGQLGLGDMILLKGDNEVEAIYLVGYTQNFKDKTLELELSNKKANNEFSLSIGERLTQAKEAYENTMRNKYLLNSIRLKRLGVNYDKINREFL